MLNEPLLQLELPGIPKLESGKVREVFDLGIACYLWLPTESQLSTASCPMAFHAKAKC
jgi:hypothetical protein